jgi:DNA-binding protein, YbaB/EbfC family
MNDFSKNFCLKQKELETKDERKAKKKLKILTVEGISGTNSVKVILNGEGEIIKIDISPETLKEEKTIIEDLIMAAHNNAKIKLKSKTTEEITKATGGLGIPGLKFPF